MTTVSRLAEKFSKKWRESKKKSDKHNQIYKKGGHGTGILTAGIGLEKPLLDFFRQNL